MIVEISASNAPALGDLRAAGEADYIYIWPDALLRGDWPRYWDALGVALARGAIINFVGRPAREGA